MALVSRHMTSTGMFPLATWRMCEEDIKAKSTITWDMEWHFKRSVQVCDQSSSSFSGDKLSVCLLMLTCPS